MNENDVFLVPRSIVDRSWYKDKVTFLVYLRLLLTSEDGKRRCTIRELGNEMGLSTQQIKAVLERLQKTADASVEAVGEVLSITVNAKRGEGGGETT